MQFIPLSEAGGADVHGINLEEEQSEELIGLLKKKCIEHSFLLFRNQRLTLSRQLIFAQGFGQALDGANNSIHPEGSFVTSTGEIPLHFDHWLIGGYPQPFHFTMLFALQVTPEGGETVFANVRRAYGLLPDSVKKAVEGMDAVHCYNYYDNTAAISHRIREKELSQEDPRATHSVIRHHEDTGEPVIYISPRNTDRILGISEQDSESTLQLLFSYIQRPENTFTHKWVKGDLLVWDNFSVLHGRKIYDNTFERKLRRMCIL